MTTYHTPHGPLVAAEAAMSDLPEQIVPSSATIDRIAAIALDAEARLLPKPAQSWSASRWQKMTALVLSSAALVAVIVGTMQTPQKSFAFEDIVIAVRKADTVSYTTVITPKNGPSSSFKSIHKGPATRMIHADGSYTITDLASQKMLMVHPTLKTATLTKLGNAAKNAPTMRDSMISWLKSAEAAGRPVGEKMVDGVRTVGFESDFGAVTLTLWSDPKTKLPMLIESTIGAPSEGTKMTMREFVFNAPVDDSVFSTEAPSGYQLKEIEQPKVDYVTLVKLPAEEHVVRILKFYSNLHDGQFPERIDGPELVSKLSARAGAKRMDDPQFMKEFTELSASMGVTWTFRQTIGTFGYVGNAHLNDADKIVFWYLPKNAEKYRVVYADLTIRDVPEEKLPKAAGK